MSQYITLVAKNEIKSIDLKDQHYQNDDTTLTKKGTERKPIPPDLSWRIHPDERKSLAVDLIERPIVLRTGRPSRGRIIPMGGRRYAKSRFMPTWWPGWIPWRGIIPLFVPWWWRYISRERYPGISWRRYYNRPYLNDPLRRVLRPRQRSRPILRPGLRPDMRRNGIKRRRTRRSNMTGDRRRRMIRAPVDIGCKHKVDSVSNYLTDFNCKPTSGVFKVRYAKTKNGDDKYVFDGRRPTHINLDKNTTYMFKLCDIPLDKPFFLYDNDSVYDKDGHGKRRLRCLNKGISGDSHFVIKPSKDTPSELYWGTLDNTRLGCFVIK